MPHDSPAKGCKTNDIFLHITKKTGSGQSDPDYYLSGYAAAAAFCSALICFTYLLVLNAYNSWAVIATQMSGSHQHTASYPNIGMKI